MKELFTRQAIVESIGRCWKRFPASCIFTGLLTLYGLYLIGAATPALETTQRFVIIYYLSVGIVLSYVLQLWGEEIKRKRIIIGVKTVLHALLAVDSIYLFCTPESLTTLESLLIHSSVLTALGLSAFIVPFFREKNDLASWNFTTRMITYAISSVGIGLVMTGGLSLLLASLNALFGVNVNSEVYISLALLCNFTLPTLLILGLTPEGEHKHDRTAYVSGFLNKTIRYLLLPLLGCYLAVLYCYGVMILVEMELPNGWISKLVITLMAGCLCVESGFYPSIRQSSRPFERIVARWLPVAILPLLVLMSVAVGRRIHDYGITVSRLYLLALNVWFYIVCIGLCIGRARRIHWITASFAGLFILLSAFPVNVVSITRDAIRREVGIFFAEKGPELELPLDRVKYEEWLRSMTPEEAERIGSLLSYLDRTLDDKTVNQWIDTKSSWFNYTPVRKNAPRNSFYAGASANAVTHVPQGYPAMRSYWFNAENARVKNDTLMFDFKVDDNTKRPVRLPVKLLRTLNEQSEMVPMTIYADHDYHITMDRFNLDLDTDKDTSSKYAKISFNCNGYIFMKK